MRPTFGTTTAEDVKLRTARQNDALREIAGRLQRLSYRDMLEVASALRIQPDDVLRGADILATA